MNRPRYMCVKCHKETYTNKGSTRVGGLFVCPECSKPKEKTK